jgi:hypothetical protein
MTLCKIPGRAALHALGPILPACVALAACSSTPAAPPQAFVDVTFLPYDMNETNYCREAASTNVLTFGVAVASPGPPTPITTGNSGVSVDCSVSSAGQLSLSARRVGMAGGSLTITGAVTSTGGAVSADIDVPSYDGDFSENDGNCMVSFTYQSEPISTQKPLAEGRIWGHLSCPAMVNTESTVPVGATQVNETCHAEVDFLFQRCAE